VGVITGHYWFTINNGGVQRTSEFGTGWQTALSINLPSPVGFSATLSSFEHNLYINTFQGLYLSEDYGDHWIKITESLEDMIGPLNNNGMTPIHSLAGILYSSNGKLFFSPDKGETWQEFVEGIGGIPISFDGISTDNGFYLAVINEDGNVTFWKRDFSDAHLTTFSGVVYADDNGNGVHEPTEPVIPQAMVHLKEANQYISSHANGSYKFVAHTLPDTLCLVPPCLYCEINPHSYIVDSTSSGLDFGVHFLPGIKDLSITITASSPFVPGFDRLLVVTVKNIGTTIESGEVNLKLDPSILFTGADPSLFSNVGDSLLTWIFNTLPPMDELNFYAYIKTPSDVPIGSLLHFTANLTPLINDHDPQNNEYVLPDQMVVGSYDPNDKQVEPPYFSSNAVANNFPLNYTVRFQNTGNFPASFVTIVDTLSQNLDPASFQVLAHSHPMTWLMRGNGIVEFRFINIDLPGAAAICPPKMR
jgi:uncharacterized repeat protein (TIGR01451 family)